MIALCVISDGRYEYLEQALDSIRANFEPFDYTIFVDDSANDPAATRSSFDCSIFHPERRGLAASVQSAWLEATRVGADFLFHAEEDFTYNGPVDVDRMANCLRRLPHLCQLVLKRQPWSPEEIAAGGQMETNPTAYTERITSCGRFTEHRTLFSLNPSLIPRRVFAMGWPSGNEAGMTEVLNASPGNRFAYWGGKADPPRCTHIGARRSVGWAL